MSTAEPVTQIGLMDVCAVKNTGRTFWIYSALSRLRQSTSASGFPSGITPIFSDFNLHSNVPRSLIQTVASLCRALYNAARPVFVASYRHVAVRSAFTSNRMFGKPKNPEANRYYLLPGQGRGARRKHRQQLGVAVFAGLAFSALLAAALWYFNSRR